MLGYDANGASPNGETASTATAVNTALSGTLVSETIDGQVYAVSVSTTGTPVSGTITIPADLTAPAGASTIGPIAMTLGAGTASYTVPLQAGKYGKAIIVLKDAQNNTVSVAGTTARTLLSITGGGTDVPPVVVVTPPEVDTTPIVTAVTVSPATVSLTGTTKQFSAVATGLNNPAQTFTWTTTVGTISSTGLLTVMSTSAIQTGTVTATSTVTPGKSFTANFTVPASVVIVDPPPVDTDPPPEDIPLDPALTRVMMHFFTPELVPLANNPVEVQIRSADYINNVSGIIMPRLIRLVTDENGRCEADLLPCDTLYYVTVEDVTSEAVIFYKFYVPVSATPVRLQDIVVDIELPNSFDDAALAALLDMRRLFAELAGPDGAGLIGYKTSTVKAALDSGTGGGGNRDEVLLVPDSTNTITPDGTLSNRFRFVMTADTKIANPLNFANDEHIYMTGRQDTAGGHVLKFGLDYMLPGALPYVPPPGGGAMFLMEARPTLNPITNSINWALWGHPSKDVSNGFSLVTEIAAIGTTRYFTMAQAMGAVADGQTIVVLRNGVSSEATGSIPNTIADADSKVFRVYGAPVDTNGADPRPMLRLPTYDFGEGPPRGANRPSFGKAVLNFEGKGTVYVRDLKVSGARNIGGNAHGLTNNADALNLVVRNVEITDCNNGILSGNQGMLGTVLVEDVMINKCGVGGPDAYDSHHTGSSSGFTHSVYFGHNNSTVTIRRTSMTESVNGNNLKCRTGTLIASQLLCSGAREGRELEISNGGHVEIDNSSFIKPADSNNGHLCIVGNSPFLNGEEGIDTSRPRSYKFTNCLFKSDYVAGGVNGRDGYIFCSFDRDVPIEFVDCRFEGSLIDSTFMNGSLYDGMVAAHGIRTYPSASPIFTYTGGPNGPVSSSTPINDWTYAPLGPVLPVGYFPIAMTPIA